MVGGLWGLMKDAAYVTSDTVTSLTNNRTTITTTAPMTAGTNTTTLTNNNNGHSYPMPTQEVKLPDGQRLAYRDQNYLTFCFR